MVILNSIILILFFSLGSYLVAEKDSFEGKNYNEMMGTYILFGFFTLFVCSCIVIFQGKKRLYPSFKYHVFSTKSSSQIPLTIGLWIVLANLGNTILYGNAFMQHHFILGLIISFCSILFIPISNKIVGKDKSLIQPLLNQKTPRK